MYKNDRLNLILDILKRRKSISMKELQALTFSSNSTLRRDVITLEQDHKVVRKYGQVELVKSKNVEFPYQFRNQEHEAQKQHIASIATDFVGDNMALFLDSSSTVAQLIPFLEQRRNLIVITNGLFNAVALNQFSNVKTFIAGGRLRSGSGSIVGGFAMDYLENFTADIAFISCSSIDGAGIYMSSAEQSSVKRKMQSAATQTILLCDSSKVGQRNYYKLSELSGITALVTDQQPEAEMMAQLQKNDVEVLY